MPTKNVDTRNAHLVPMRVCRVYSDHGKVATTRVQCPAVAQMREVTECLSCSCYAGVAFGVTAGVQEANLLCREEPRRQFTARSCGTLPSAANQIPVWAIMHSEVFCALPSVTIEFTLSLLLDKGISGLPVVDAEGFPLGMVSKTDLVRWMHETTAPAMTRTTVAEVMAPLAFTLPSDAVLSHAAALMAIEGVHRLPIVAPDGKVVGILSALDIVRWLAKHDGYIAEQ